MKSHVLAVGVFVCSLAVSLYAGQGNPMSNVLYDTAATANTLVMRDSSGNVALGAGDIVTADIATNVVDTSKVNFVTPTSVSSGKIVCIMGGNLQQFGICTAAVTGSSCTCG